MLVRTFVQWWVHSISQSKKWLRSSSGTWALRFQCNMLHRNELHSHQRALSIMELGLDPPTACVFSWDDLAKPVSALLLQWLGLWVLSCLCLWVGSAVPLPIPDGLSRPWWPRWARGLGCRWLSCGCPWRAAKASAALAALRRGLAALCSCSCCNDLRVAAAEGSRLGPPVFPLGTSVFLRESHFCACVCEVGMLGCACLEKSTKQKELGNEEQKVSVLPSHSLDCLGIQTKARQT